MAKKENEKSTAVAKTDETAIIKPHESQKSLSDYFAGKVGVTPADFLNTVRKTCFKGVQVQNEIMIMFLAVAKEYNLNPFTKEIYAFEKDGAVSIIVPIDGWLNIINSNPQHDGLDCVENYDDSGKLVSCTTTIHRKDRKHPTVITEYLEECFVEKSHAWQKWPVRMLRHKSIIQAARVAYSLSNIYDPDEADRIQNANVIDSNVSDSAAKGTADKLEDFKGRNKKEEVAPEDDGETIIDVEVEDIEDEPKAEENDTPEEVTSDDKAPDTVSEAKDKLIAYLRDCKEAELITESEYVEAAESAAKPGNKNIEYMTQQLSGWKELISEKQGNTSGDGQGQMDL